MFKPYKTNDKTVTERSNALIYALHGFGKTTQCRYYKETFGKGFIISGEGGLTSISDQNIDYLPFRSWDGPNDPEKGIYSFRGICKIIQSPEFHDAGYKWIAIDSLTEASDLLNRELDIKFKDDPNGFKQWQEFATQMIGSLKWLRDTNYHILVTALAKEKEDEYGRVTYWPHVHGQATAKQIPALFDHVFAGVRETEKIDDEVVVQRKLICDELHGYHGKIRDPLRRIPPVLNTSNVAEVIKAIHLEGSEFKKWLDSLGG